ncbi:MAG: NUDIX hydrolase [Microcoleaceae cyanobacterium]
MKRSKQFIQTVLGIIFRHPVTGASVVPILPNGEIVLVQRQDNGKWALPGGMVDWGETIPNTIRRELAEETGLKLIQIRRLVGVYSEPDRDPRLHSICVLAEADVEGILQAQDTLEIRDVKAFPTDALPMEDLSYDYQRQIQDYLAGRTTIS